MVGLVLTGALYSVFAPAQAADDTTESAAEAAGRQLYENSCITCHGANLQGVPKRGPSLIGVGEAAVFFQVHTGRMPLVRQEADAHEKPPVFSDKLSSTVLPPPSRHRRPLVDRHNHAGT